jgi:hypothetical protein
MSGAHGTFSMASPEMKCAASPGGTFKHCMCVALDGQQNRNAISLPSQPAKMDIAGENGGSMHIRKSPTLAWESLRIVVL